jgi:hypothetical protein
MSKSKTIPITNLELTATLFYFDFPIVSLDNSNIRQTIFNFEDSTDLQRTMEAFLMGKLLCEPKRFWNCIRDAKTLIYSSNKK